MRPTVVKLALAVLLSVLAGLAAHAQDLALAGRTTRLVEARAALLASPELRTVELFDPVYGRRMTYRAIPMATLLRRLAVTIDDYVQARATDDFSVSIPAHLLAFADPGRLEAFLAIEDPAAPWPTLPGKSYSAGPFAIVWKLGPSMTISSEYWAYRLAALTVTDSPAKRWPTLAVGSEVPTDSPIRAGLDAYISYCMACHRFEGAGEGAQGPDLGHPNNPVEVFRIPALRQLIRNSASVRKWPDQKMPAFGPDVLSDADLDAILAWLDYKAGGRR